VSLTRNPLYWFDCWLWPWQSSTLNVLHSAFLHGLQCSPLLYGQNAVKSDKKRTVRLSGCLQDPFNMKKGLHPKNHRAPQLQQKFEQIPCETASWASEGFFQGKATSGFFQRFLWGVPKVVKFVFSHSKFRKQLILLKFSKSKGQGTPFRRYWTGTETLKP